MRIAGINIPGEKRLDIGLTALYGIGRSRARQILTDASIELGKHGSDLSAEEEAAIRKIVEVFKLEGDLKREISGNIKRLKDIKSYRGSRHSKSLPSRGQRTKSNSRTRRGNVRKTMGSGRKKLEKK